MKMMDKRNLDFANELLEVSKDDLKRSKRDYEYKDYSGAINNLQLSAEKAVNAYFVLMGFESEDLKKFQHDPIDKKVLMSVLMLFSGHTFRNLIGGYYIFPIMPINMTLEQAEFNHKLITKKHLALFDDRLKILKMEKRKIEDYLNYPLDSDYVDYTDKITQIGGELYLQQWDNINEIVKKVGGIKKYEAMDYVAGIKIVDIDKAS